MKICGKAPPRSRAGPAVVAALAAFLLPSVGGAMTIDTFEAGQFSLTLSAPGTTSGTQGSSLTNVIGGEREVTLNWTGPTSGYIVGTDDAVANVPSSPPILSWNEDDGIYGWLKLVYDGTGSTGLGGVDLTDAGTSPQMLVDFQMIDQDADVKITLTDTAATPVSHSVTKTVDVTGYTTNLIVAFELSDFATAGVDTTKIDKIEYLFTSTAAGDYQIRLLESGIIPEPLTMLAVFTGVTGLAGYLRKRRSA